MECDHPLAREPGLAKGILHRHANSTNAPVRKKRQIRSAMGFSYLFLHVCTTCLLQIQLTLCASTIDVVWSLGCRAWVSQAGRVVNTTQGPENLHHFFFPDRCKRTAFLGMTIVKKILWRGSHASTSACLQCKLCTSALELGLLLTT